MERYHSKLYEGKDLLLEQYLVRGGSYQLCWHRAVEILLVLRGEVEAYVDGELKQLKQDDMTLINSNCVHSLFVKDPSTLFLVTEIHPGYLRKIPELRNQALYINFTTDEKSRANPFVAMVRYYCAETFSHSLREGKLEARLAEQYLGVLLYELIAKFGIGNTGARTSHERQHEVLQGAMDYIEQNYDMPITLEQVAEKAQYNRTYISTLFKSNLGMSFRDYLVRVRLRHAVELLAETDLPILQIALDCGFSNANSLTTSTKKYCGKNPQEYRNAFKSTDHDVLYALKEENKYLPYPNAEAEQLLLRYKERGFVYSGAEQNRLREELQRLKELGAEIVSTTERAMEI